MAIDTTAKKLSLMTLGQVYQSAVPGTGTLNQADLQHMLWGYIDPLWFAVVGKVSVAITALQPGVAMTALQPGVASTPLQPGVAITEVE